MSIRPALQAVAMLSTRSTDLTGSEGENVYGLGDLEAFVVLTLSERSRFMQGGELPLKSILGN